MSTEENVQLVKNFFAAMGSSNAYDLLALAAEDIEWIIPGEGWPLAGTHRGHAELAAVLKKASEEVETQYPKPPEFVAQVDRVMVVGVATGKIKATNRPFKDEWVFDISFEAAKSPASRSTSTRKHWRGPRRSTQGPSQVRRVSRDGMTRCCADQHPFPERAPIYDFHFKRSVA
ncbi:ketosteroid isomerase-like protein [Bradyrhizobium diazoefficiens]